MGHESGRKTNSTNHYIPQTINGNNPLILIICLIIGIATGVLVTIFVLDNDENHKINFEEKENVIEQSVASKDVIEETNEEYFIIETSNGNLYYPLKWKEQVRVEIAEDKDMVTFLGTIGKKGEQLLFKIYFKGDDGAYIGDLNQKPVYISSTTDNVDEDWTEDEKTLFYSMQEDVNYLIERLKEEKTFVLAE